MIAGCYTLDLYCDSGRDKRHEFEEFPHQYTAEFGSECRSRARRAGWLINERADRAICPKCNPKSNRYIPPLPQAEAVRP